jgi:hypothetical protein
MAQKVAGFLSAGSLCQETFTNKFLIRNNSLLLGEQDEKAYFRVDTNCVDANYFVCFG